jgi:hypothetical protein
LPKEALNQLNQAGVNIEILSDNTLTLEQRLAELAKIQGNSTAIVKTFGIENAVAAQTLIENRDRVAELTVKMKEQGTAAAQAEERTNTINGELKKLANTWQALIIKFGQGGGSLKNTIKFIRENLETIVDVVINVTQAFLTYKAAVMAVNAAYKTKDIVSYIMNLSKVKKATEAAEAAQQGVNRAMKANIWGIAAAGLITLIDQLDLFKSAADLAAESQERINSAVEKGVQALEGIEQQYRDNIALLEQDYDLRIRQARIDRMSAEQIKKLEQEKSDAVKNGSLQAYKSLLVTAEQANQRLKELEDFANKIGSRASGSTLLGLGQSIGIGADMSVNEAISAQKKFIEQIKERAKLAKLELKEGELDRKEAINEQIQETETLTKAQADAYKKAREDQYQALLRMIEQEKIQEEIAILRTRETEEKKAELKRLAERSYLEKRLAIDKEFGKEFEKVELELVQKKIEIENAEIDRKRKLAEKMAEIQRLIDEQDIKNTEDRFERERLQALHEFEEKITQLEKEGKLTNELEIGLKKELVNKLNKINAEESDADLDERLKEYDNYYKQLELEALRSGKTQEEIDAELHKQKISRLEEEIALRKSLGKEAIDQEIELERLKQEEKEKLAERNQELIKEFSDLAIEKYEERLQRERDIENQRLDDEIEKRKSNIERQRELAQKGIDNTLVFEEQKLAQAELKKEKLRQKELKDEKRISFLKLLQGYATEGKASEAVRRALADIAISEIIGASFYEGTEDTGKGGKLDSKGGFAAVLHPNERVMTAEQNAKMGGTPNEDVADIVKSYNQGELIPKYLTPSITIPGKSTELHYTGELVNEVKSLRSDVNNVFKAIKDRPVTSGHFSGLGEYVEKRVTSNRTDIIKHYRKKSRL